MDDDLTTTGPPTEVSWPRPPAPMELEEALPPLEREHLLELLQGDRESDATESIAAFTARGRGALDLAIADGLAAMRVGDRLITLGFSGVGDYGREILGIKDRTAQSMARFSLELSKRPQLRAAVRSGEVRIRKAQVVLPVAIGDSEAEWIQLAKEQTILSPRR